MAAVTLINIEEHFLAAEVRQAWQAISLGASDPSVALHSGPLEKRLPDLADERPALMNESGLDVQVLSLPAMTSTQQAAGPPNRIFGPARKRSRVSRSPAGYTDTVKCAVPFDSSAAPA